MELAPEYSGQIEGQDFDLARKQSLDFSFLVNGWKGPHDEKYLVVCVETKYQASLRREWSQFKNKKVEDII